VRVDDGEVLVVGFSLGLGKGDEARVLEFFGQVVHHGEIIPVWNVASDMESEEERIRMAEEVSELPAEADGVGFPEIEVSLPGIADGFETETHGFSIAIASTGYAWGARSDRSEGNARAIVDLAVALGDGDLHAMYLLR
jgi:hypothetical protein